jgi:integrase
MARPATGQVIERRGKRGASYSIRLTLPNGERPQRRLGREADGWSRRRAEDELRNVLADVRRDLPNDRLTPPEEKPNPLFAVFAHDWFEGKRCELRPNTVLDYEWRIVRHLLPWFGGLPLSAITAQEVDRYKRTKAGEQGALSAESINKTIVLLAQIMDVAVEYELVERNPAKGKNRRLRTAKPTRTYIDSADGIEALLTAAGELDAEGRAAPYRRALLAVLVFAGLRIDEALSLRWEDVSLPARRLRVVQSKTDAGRRDVTLRPALVDELSHLRAHARGDRSALVFGTATGRKMSQSNVRTRVLAKAVERANVSLAARELPPLPARLTPHSLRRTFVSLMAALNEPMPDTMREAGHTSPNVTLGIYAQAMSRTDGERERLRALIDGDRLDAVSARFGADRAPATSEQEVRHAA